MTVRASQRPRTNVQRVKGNGDVAASNGQGQLVIRPGASLLELEAGIQDPNKDSWFFERVMREPEFGIHWLRLLGQEDIAEREGALFPLTRNDFDDTITKGAVFHKCGDCDHTKAMKAAVEAILGNDRLFDLSWLVGGVTAWPLSVFNESLDSSPMWDMAIRVAREDKGVEYILLMPHIPCLGVYHRRASLYMVMLELLHAEEHIIRQHPGLKVVTSMHKFDSVSRVIRRVDRDGTVDMLHKLFGAPIDPLLPRTSRELRDAS